MLISWNPVVLRDVGSGEPFVMPPYLSDTPLILLNLIEAMPKALPLSLAEASWLAATEAYTIFNSQGGRASAKFMDYWIKWISEQGYHIELTGEEFEIKIKDA